MAKLISAYQALDGTEFSTELEADAHDLKASLAASVAAFAETLKLGKAQSTRAGRMIAEYTVFMQTYEAPAAATAEA